MDSLETPLPVSKLIEDPNALRHKLETIYMNTHGIDSEAAISVIGLSMQGKTTLIGILLGLPFTVTQKLGNPNEWICQCPGLMIQNEENDGQSTTQVHQVHQAEFKGEVRVIIDNPGADDNVDLGNQLTQPLGSFLHQETLKKQLTVFVISDEDLNNGGRHLAPQLPLLSEGFQDQSKLDGHFHVVVQKAVRTKQQAIAAFKLAEKSKIITGDSRKLLELINKNPQNIHVVPKPTGGTDFMETARDCREAILGFPVDQYLDLEAYRNETGHSLLQCVIPPTAKELASEQFAYYGK